MDKFKIFILIVCVIFSIVSCKSKDEKSYIFYGQSENWICIISNFVIKDKVKLQAAYKGNVQDLNNKNIMFMYGAAKGNASKVLSNTEGKGTFYIELENFFINEEDSKEDAVVTIDIYTKDPDNRNHVPETINLNKFMEYYATPIRN